MFDVEPGTIIFIPKKMNKCRMEMCHAATIVRFSERSGKKIHGSYYSSEPMSLYPLMLKVDYM